jgi:hypothetical protein
VGIATPPKTPTPTPTAKHAEAQSNIPAAIPLSIVNSSFVPFCGPLEITPSLSHAAVRILDRRKATGV